VQVEKRRKMSKALKAFSGSKQVEKIQLYHEGLGAVEVKLEQLDRWWADEHGLALLFREEGKLLIEYYPMHAVKALKVVLHAQGEKAREG